MNNGEIRKILDMVKDGKITPEEGEKLILAVMTSKEQQDESRAKALRIMAVKDGKRANLSFIRLWLKLRPNAPLKVDIDGNKIEIPVRKIIEEIASGNREIIEVETDDGKYAKIWIE